MRRAGLGEYLASLPYQFGYELDNHVVVIGLGEGSPKLSAAFEWTDNRELIEQSEAFVAGFTPPMQKENIDSLLIVGYGPEGQAPAQITVNYGEAITLPVNRTLYKDGYTLTGWQGDGKLYTPGQTVTLKKETVTLTAIYTQNKVNMPDRITDVNVIWDFTEEGAPSLSGSGISPEPTTTCASNTRTPA